MIDFSNYLKSRERNGLLLITGNNVCASAGLLGLTVRVI